MMQFRNVKTKQKQEVIMNVNRQVFHVVLYQYRFFPIIQACKGVILLLLFFIASFTFENVALAQTQWVRNAQNPVLTPGPAGSWDSHSILGSSVLFVDGIYQMWYAGNDGLNYSIGRATSTDGINWTKDSLNPVVTPGTQGSWDDYFVYLPCVIRIGTSYHMWYAGNNLGQEQIGHAVSIDGIYWTKDAMNPVLETGSAGSWDDQEVFPMPGSVIYDGSIFKMWYGGLSNNTGEYASGYATSPDGSTWTKDNVNNPVFQKGQAGDFDWYGAFLGTLWFDGSSYKAWYSGSGDDYRYRIGYATSQDGISWIKHTSDNPVMDYASIGSWDYHQIWNPMVLYDTTEHNLKMWYTGGPITSGQIGYATSMLTSLEEHDPIEQNRHLVVSQASPNPFNAQTYIKCKFKHIGEKSISLIDLAGNQIFIRKEQSNEYEQIITITGQGLGSGMYYYIIESEFELAVGKLIKVDQANTFK